MAIEKEYTDNQIGWVKTYTDAEVRAVREAVKVVAETNTAKFEAQNEWRAQMKDQVEKFAPREFVDNVRDITIRQIDATRESLLKIIEKQDALIQKQEEKLVTLERQNSYWLGRFIGAVAVLGVLEILLKYVFK